MTLALKPLAQQSIVITGASSGIGLATARRAAEVGAKVLLVARNEEALKEAVHQIVVRGGRAAYLAVDVADDDAPARISERAVEAFGGFDTWVNNAAAATYARLTDMTIDEYRRLFDVGFFGTVTGSLEAARQLRDKGGAIINVGSVLSERAVPLQGGYSSMKHAVRGFTDALRMELEMDGAPISVTLIKPNGIDTPYPEHARNKMDEPARIPPIVYDPELVAKAICFAAENQKRELTVGGQGLLVSKLGNAMPRTIDRFMEAVFEPLQKTDKPPRPGMSDNLFEAREDGHVHGQAGGYVRKTSLALEAQMRPWAAAALVGGAAAALTALVAGVRRSGEADRQEPRTGRDDDFVGIADENMIPATKPDYPSATDRYA
ncbi:short-subunit dehydrogenase [Sphingomonas jejuensis]|uniref:Short-subunit dehydrogenase n=1 Tax=Sphingomonas jejuensis TaxID=904715 RepID=A0ABX0XL09_9SPHN|nr:SDR family oxidoreductase [Sphingomonas jejuensis]NJC33411.1 short-subunit dehydrogenase [Sphingomonas jejuensis]